MVLQPKCNGFVDMGEGLIMKLGKDIYTALRGRVVVLSDRDTRDAAGLHFLGKVVPACPVAANGLVLLAVLVAQGGAASFLRKKEVARCSLPGKL